MLRPVFWVGMVGLLLPAASITLCRLLQPEPGLAVQLVTFTPLAAPLYAAGLLLALVYALVHRARRASLRTLAWPVVLLCLVALVLHAAWFAPLVTGDEPDAADDDAERITVMTVNLFRGWGDTAQVTEVVREHGVDVVVASEITPRSLNGLRAAGLHELLRYSAGEPGAERMHDGTMVFTREPLEGVSTLDTEMGSLLFTVGDLQVMGVHPSPPVFPELWRADHAVLHESVIDREPDVVLGDFNATLDHAPMRALREGGYRDAVELTNGGFQPTWPINLQLDLRKGIPGVIAALGPFAQIDHVLVGDRVAVTEVDTRNLAGSDHRMVLATVAEREAD